MTVDSSESRNKLTRIDGGLAISPGEKIAERGEGFPINDAPIGCDVRITIVKEDAGGISLGGVIVAWPIGGLSAVERLAPGDGLMVKQPVDGKARQADIRVKDNQAALGSQHTPSFLEKCTGRFEVMENVEQYQMRDGARVERQFVTVAHYVQPGIGENVSANGAWKMC